ncbi:MAG: hypothetical protein C0469_00345, partial [Cyanobacteria bacterium DS2.3.42]|nr:hypothetical protein [Cyanobacteria bacterium DS2.3.42]
MNSRLKILEEDKSCCLALHRVGVQINSVYDLSNYKCDYPSAIPVLLELLNEVETPNIKEGVVRGLGVKHAKGIAEPALIKEFLSLPITDASSMVKWVIGNSLYILGTIDAHFEAIADIVKDPSHGIARQMLVMLLGKSKIHKELAEKVAFELLEDPDVQGHAISALGNLRSTKSMEAIERFL